MAFTTAAENLALTGIVNAGGSPSNRYISLFTADPGSTGSGMEVAGGSYARVATTWNTPTGSSVVGSAVTINVPSGTTITYWGIWSAVTTGTFIYGGILPASETFGSNGTYTLTPTITAGDPV